MEKVIEVEEESHDSVIDVYQEYVDVTDYIRKILDM